MLNTDCLDLAGFEPVTIFFQHRFKMPRELWGEGRVRVKNHCVGLRPAPPLADNPLQSSTNKNRDMIRSEPWLENDTSCFEKHLH